MLRPCLTSSKGAGDSKNAVVCYALNVIAFCVKPELTLTSTATYSPEAIITNKQTSVRL